MMVCFILTCSVRNCLQGALRRPLHKLQQHPQGAEHIDHESKPETVLLQCPVSLLQGCQVAARTGGAGSSVVHADDILRKIGKTVPAILQKADHEFIVCSDPVFGLIKTIALIDLPLQEKCGMTRHPAGIQALLRTHLPVSDDFFSVSINKVCMRSNAAGIFFDQGCHFGYSIVA